MLKEDELDTPATIPNGEWQPQGMEQPMALSLDRGPRRTIRAAPPPLLNAHPRPPSPRRYFDDPRNCFAK